MKKKQNGMKRVFLLESVTIFVTVAFLFQMGILTYEYIRTKTESKPLIAVLLLVLILIIATVCLLVDIVRRRIVQQRPLKKIMQATEKISSGNFNVVLSPDHPYGKYNAYDVIMLDINTMAAELKKNEALNTDFISNVTHELKTPLALSSNYATLLQDKSLDDESREKYAKTLINATKRLSDLIANMLRLNKLENQVIKPEYGEVNLTELLEGVVVDYVDIIEQKDIELVCDFDDVKIITAVGYTDIVWRNLISNAVKFTDNGGKITVSLKATATGAIISVEDTGCGIPSEIGGRIFDKFYQGDTSHSQQGNGLGLALVKKVITHIGGKISVSSEVGKGSTFVVEIYGEKC